VCFGVAPRLNPSCFFLGGLCSYQASFQTASLKMPKNHVTI
jgi:hypothetical protein